MSLYYPFQYFACVCSLFSGHGVCKYIDIEYLWRGFLVRLRWLSQTSLDRQPLLAFAFTSFYFYKFWFLQFNIVCYNNFKPFYHSSIKLISSGKIFRWKISSYFLQITRLSCISTRHFLLGVCSVATITNVDVATRPISERSIGSSNQIK